MENNIKKIRLRNNLTQKQLAEKIGCTQNEISRWENGDRAPSDKTLLKIAEFFGCTVDDLLAEEKKDCFNSAIECGTATAIKLGVQRTRVYQRKLTEANACNDYDTVIDTIALMGAEAELEYPFFYEVLKEYDKSKVLSDTKKYLYFFINALNRRQFR